MAAMGRLAEEVRAVEEKAAGEVATVGWEGAEEGEVVKVGAGEGASVVGVGEARQVEVRAEDLVVETVG